MDWDHRAQTDDQWLTLVYRMTKSTGSMRSKVVTAVTMKTAVLWDFTPCTLSNMYKNTRCHLLQGGHILSCTLLQN
jgi:hypothetical protein